MQEQEKLDELFMRKALEQAQMACDKGEVPVGAVVVQGGQLVAAAGNAPRALCDPSAHAEVLALQTVLGTARLIDETALTPQTAREAICSPGGTTLAALDAMSAAGFASSIDEGIAAAVKRSKELAQS